MEQKLVMNDEQKTAEICRKIGAICADFRLRYPVLANQDAIGLAIFGTSIALLSAGIAGYLTGMIPAWILIIWVAFWTSILHELEHDLIHLLYFRKQGFWYHVMMLGVWVFRPLTLNPWLRKHWHYHHHKYSGLSIDLEERGVTNGERWSLVRLLVMPDLLLGFASRFRRLRRDIREDYRKGRLSRRDISVLRKTVCFGFLPFGVPLYLLWYMFVLFHLLKWTGGGAWVAGWHPMIEAISPWMVIGVIPNLLRQFCLHFITSNLHYYGDVQPGHFLQQTQVLNIWWTWPLQVFCFNFGSTHAIHHFVVNEPFYIRQWTSRSALNVLRNYGVRFNDLGTFARANRWSKD